MRTREVAATLGVFLAGWACGGGGSAAVAEVSRLIEIGGASLARQLEQAGPPPIEAGVGIAERVAAEDGKRHFTLTVANETLAGAEDSVALYALADGHGSIGEIWGANILAFAHSDMTSGAVQGLEIDVGNLGTPGEVPVTGLNVFAIGPRPSDVAIGILNGTAAGNGGFRTGIAFRSNAPGRAVTDALLRVDPGFGRVARGIDLREADFADDALATPGFSVAADGGVRSRTLATGATAFACVDAEGRLFPSRTPCR
ncbi:MAG: hypothetical protein RL698_927 [Pseudomonadota bacterium]|jgi:hypothetical protein